MILTVMTADTLSNYLKSQIRKKYKTFEAFARSRGMSYHSIKSIFYRKQFPNWILAEFEIEQMVTFRKKNKSI